MSAHVLEQRSFLLDVFSESKNWLAGQLFQEAQSEYGSTPGAVHYIRERIRTASGDLLKNATTDSRQEFGST